MTQAQRWVLGQGLEQYEPGEAALTRVAERITQEVESSADPLVPEAVKLLDTIPGVGETVAQLSVAEIGVDLTRFPTDHHRASGAGLGPGNTESAGKRQSGKTTKGSRYWRAALGQAAWGASHHKDTYLAAQYKRCVKRRGKQKALVAVGHRILISVSQVLPDRTSYQDLGGDDCDRSQGGQAAHAADSPIGIAGGESDGRGSQGGCVTLPPGIFIVDCRFE